MSAPHEPLPRLFLRFLRFGALAWGGPVAQIAMIQRELVEEERWIEPERFTRTLAVYQALPGPEAHELCVFFGTLARGRFGGLLAGLAFMLPGFLLMFALSWAYVAIGLESPALVAIFAGCQAAVVALVARAVHRIGGHALRGPWLVATALASLVASLLGLPFIAILLAAGAISALASRGWTRVAACALIALVLTSGALRLAREQHVATGAASQGVTSPAEAPTPARLFLSGLKTGSLTFGGAYTAIPFLQHDAVERGHWLSLDEFLDGLALGGILPAPLIIFSTFVGYVAGGALGALAMTAGIFLPAFAFTLIGHEWLERVVLNARIATFLDGMSAGVVGLIAATLIDLTRSGLGSPAAIAIFALALAATYRFKGRATVVVIILGSGALGWLLMPGG